MSNCTSGCLTQDHKNWGECIRAKSLRIGWAASASGKDLTTQKRWDTRLAQYRDARRQGIKPGSSKMKDIRHAIDESDRTGVAFDGTQKGAI